MCQTRPGPRCSAHAKSALGAARAGRGQARAEFEAARATLAAFPTPPAAAGVRLDTDPAREAAALAYQQALAVHVEADRAFEAALREYETTPEGQASLAEGIERLTAAGDIEAAQAASARLAEAAATRLRQVSDAAAARIQADRLADLSPVEQDAIAEAERAHAVAEDIVEHFGQELTAAEQALGDLHKQIAPVEAAHTEAFAAERAARAAVQEAQHTAREQVVRLYIEAGVPVRYAGYYADDCLTLATGEPRSGPQPGAADTSVLVAARPLAVKIKRGGPDAARTAEAKENSLSDPVFQAANAALTEAVAAHAEARQARTEIEQADYAGVLAQRAALTSARDTAARALETEKAIAARQKAGVDRIKALIASGSGTRAAAVSLAQAGDEIVRQPDGSTNARVYQPPSPGFPHGRFLRATGIEVLAGRANALVLEDGSRAQHTQYVQRTARGLSHSAGPYREVVVLPAKPGAIPLRQEGLAAAGYALTVDSTD